ncbi:MAG: hypothetical protein QM817_30585 [Archangium sp.]
MSVSSALMIIGHYAVAFAASRATPRLPLWQSMIAVVWLDILHSSMVIAGIEKAIVVPGITAVVPLDLAFYPYSHSLVASLGWSLLGALLVMRQGRAAALLMAACVFSHFVCDLIAHRPDLPLLLDGGEPKFGFGMWHSMWLTFTVENVLLFGTAWLYLRDGANRTRAERIGLPILCIAGSLMFFTFPFTTFPPDIRATEAVALVVYAVIAVLGWQFARSRVTASTH